VTTLAAAVDAVDKLWTIDTMPDAPFLEAGDELVEISARFPEHIYAPTQETIPAKIRVRRAVAGTAAATHAQGITLTPVYPESATSPGGGGVTVDNQSDPPAEVTILELPGATLAGGTATLVVPRLLGPFRVNFDTPEVSTNGVELAGSAFVAGAVIIRTWAVHTDPAAAWNPAGSVEFQVLDWATQTVLLSLYDPKLVGFPGQELTRISAQPTNLSDHPYVSPDANSIGVYVDIASGTPTAGSADVYAVIVEPA
jgi:hypothetical protein